MAILGIFGLGLVALGAITYDKCEAKFGKDRTQAGIAGIFVAICILLKMAS